MRARTAGTQDRPAPRRTLGATGAGALAVALVLVGCSSGSGGDEPEPAGTGEQAAGAGAQDASGAGSSGGGSSGGGSSGGGASGAGVREQDLQDVLVEQTVSLPGSPDDQVTLGVQSLTVEDEVMVLRMVVTPDFATESDDATISLFDALEDRSFRPTLVDRENLTEYSLVTDSGSTWSSDPVETEAVNGSPFPVWGVFSAPQDDVDALDLRITDVWPEFTDVPLTR